MPMVQHTTISYDEWKSLFLADSEKMSILGFKIPKDSLRYQLFITQPVCVHCGRVGTKMVLEGDPKQRPHFNLYTEDGILMTKDHILPASKGGRDLLENMQPMCRICNKARGNGDGMPPIYASDTTGLPDVFQPIPDGVPLRVVAKNVNGVSYWISQTEAAARGHK